MSEFEKYTLTDFQRRAISKPIVFGQNHHLLWELSGSIWVFDCRVDTNKVYYFDKEQSISLQTIYDIVNNCISDGLIVPIEIVIVLLIKFKIKFGRVNHVESELKFPPTILNLNLDLLTSVIRLRIINDIVSFSDFQEYATEMKQIYIENVNIDPNIQSNSNPKNKSRLELFQIEKLILNGVYSRVFTSTPIAVKFQILKEETRKFLMYGLSSRGRKDSIRVESFMLYITEILAKRYPNPQTNNFEWVEDALIISCLQLCDSFCKKQFSWFSDSPNINEKVNKIQQITELNEEYKLQVVDEDVESSIENYTKYIQLANRLIDHTKTTISSSSIQSLNDFAKKYMSDIYLATYNITRQTKSEENTQFTDLLTNIDLEFTRYFINQSNETSSKLEEYNMKLIELFNLKSKSEPYNIPPDKLDKYIQKKVLDALNLAELSSIVIFDDESKVIICNAYTDITFNILAYSKLRFKHVYIINQFINCFKRYEQNNRVQQQSIDIPTVPILKNQDYNVTSKELKQIALKIGKVIESMKDIVLGKTNIIQVYAQLFSKQAGLVNVYIKKYHGDFNKTPRETITEIVNIESIENIRTRYNQILVDFQTLATNGIATFKEFINRFRFVIDFKFKFLRLFKLVNPRDLTKITINKVTYALNDIILDDLEKPKPNYRLNNDQFMGLVEFRSHYTQLMNKATNVVQVYFKDLNNDIDSQILNIIERYNTINKLDPELVKNLYQDRSELMTKIIQRANAILNGMRNINKVVQLSMEVVNVDFKKQDSTAYLKSINVNQHIQYAGDIKHFMEKLFSSGSVSEQYEQIQQIQFILDAMSWSIDQYLKFGIPSINSGIAIVKNLHFHWNRLRFQTNQLKNYYLLTNPSQTVKLDNNTKQLAIREEAFKREFLKIVSTEYGLVHDKVKFWLSATSEDTENVANPMILTESILFFRRWLIIIQKMEGYLSSQTTPESFKNALSKYKDIKMLKESIINIVYRKYNKNNMDPSILSLKLKQITDFEKFSIEYIQTLEIIADIPHNQVIQNNMDQLYNYLLEKIPRLKTKGEEWTVLNNIVNSVDRSAVHEFSSKMETTEQYMSRMIQVIDRQIQLLQSLKVFIESPNESNRYYSIYGYFENDPKRFLKFYFTNGMYFTIPLSIFVTLRKTLNYFPRINTLYYSYIHVHKQVRNTNPVLLEFIEKLMYNHELSLFLILKYNVNLSKQVIQPLDNKEIVYRQRFQNLNLQWRQFEKDFTIFVEEFDVSVRAILTADFSKQKEGIDKEKLKLLYFTYERFGSRPFDDVSTQAYDMFSRIIQEIWDKENSKFIKYNELIYNQVLFKESSDTTPYNEILKETKMVIQKLFNDLIIDTLSNPDPTSYKSTFCVKLERYFES